MKAFKLDWKNYGWLIVPLVIGVVAALIAWSIVADHVEQLEGDLEQHYRQSYLAEQSANAVIDVLVAAKNLPPGAQLSAENLQVRGLNRDALPADRIPANRAMDYVGRYLRSDLATDIVRGKAIQELHLSAVGGHRLSDHLAANETAFSFRVDETQHHGGNLQIGDQVDIYARHPVGSELLLAGLTLIAIDGELRGQNTERGIRQSNALLTLAVPKQFLPQLQHSLEASQLQVLLRHPQLAHNAPERLGQGVVEWILPNQSNRQFPLQIAYEPDQGW